MAPPIRDLISSVRAGNFLTLPNDMINMTPATQFANSVTARRRQLRRAHDRKTWFTGLFNMRSGLWPRSATGHVNEPNHRPRRIHGEVREPCMTSTPE
jgi:hypothetical protein